MFFDDDHDYHDHHGHGALSAGLAYAALRQGQDQQAEDILAGIAELSSATPPAAPPSPTQLDIRVVTDTDDDPTKARDVAPTDLGAVEIPQSWDAYVGQGPLKEQMQVAILSAKARGVALPHMLFESGRPGVGKTTIARLMAKMMGGRTQLIELVPPFDNLYTVVNAAERLLDGDVLFIDEIHLLALKRGGDQFLLKLLEDKVAYLPDGTTRPMNDITIIGATTDAGVLKAPVLDRFKKRPYFQPYSLPELTRIAIKFAGRHNALDVVQPDLAVDMALACRETPRVLEQYVESARDLALALGRPPTAERLLQFMEVQPDGLTRLHVHYLTAMRKYFRRVSKDYGVEYVVGEAAMLTILRENKQGLGGIERFLIERGYIDRTPRGRRLTPRGVARAEALIAQGLGPADVA